MKREPYCLLVPMQDDRSDDESTIRVPLGRVRPRKERSQSPRVVSSIDILGLSRDPSTPWTPAAPPIADAHAVRVIERMKEREAWFTARIAQLEAHCNKVATELAEMKRKHPEPAVSPRLSLNLGDTSLPDHERIARNTHVSLLKEEGFHEGMTPPAPLYPIPTHSLKKEVSWTDLSAPPVEETPFNTCPMMRSMYQCGLFDCPEKSDAAEGK